MRLKDFKIEIEKQIGKLYFDKEDRVWRLLSLDDKGNVIFEELTSEAHDNAIRVNRNIFCAGITDFVEIVRQGD